MDTLLSLLLSIQVWCALLAAFCGYMLYRNEKVFELRTKLLLEAKDHYDKTGDAERLKWVFRASDEVTYKDMMWQFWVWPLDKFFRDVK